MPEYTPDIITRLAPGAFALFVGDQVTKILYDNEQIDEIGRLAAAHGGISPPGNLSQQTFAMRYAHVGPHGDSVFDPPFQITGANYPYFPASELAAATYGSARAFLRANISANGLVIDLPIREVKGSGEVLVGKLADALLSPTPEDDHPFPSPGAFAVRKFRLLTSSNNPALKLKGSAEDRKRGRDLILARHSGAILLERLRLR